MTNLLRDPNAELLRPGERIQRRYVVGRLLGEGGMGRIYLAKQLPFERPVAIKVMHPHYQSNEELTTRFIQEAQIISRLSHPNTVTVYEVVRHEGLLCIVMEYVEGKTLAEVLRTRGPLGLDEAVVFGVQIAQSLGEAHSKGVVHRDVKPDNIMVCEPPHNEPFIKVLDFGVAKLQGALSSQTQGQAVVGTPFYMSPEQVEGRSSDGRADLYALACCMVEMLTGQPPYTGQSSLQVMLKHREAPPPPLSPLVPRGVEAFLHRALSKRPEDRPQDAGEFIRELMASLLTRVEPAPPQPQRESLTRSPSRPPSPRPPHTLFSPLPVLLSEPEAQAWSAESPPSEELELEEIAAPDARGDQAAPRARLATPVSQLRETPAGGAVALRLEGLEALDAPVSVTMTVHGEQRRSAWRALTLDSSPAGALVTINGEAVGVTPLEYEVSEALALDVRFEREGYLPQERTGWRAPGGRAPRLFMALKRALLEVEIAAPAGGFALRIMGRDYGAVAASQPKRVQLAWPDEPLEVRLTHARYEDVVWVLPVEALEPLVSLAARREELVLKPSAPMPAR